MLFGLLVNVFWRLFIDLIITNSKYERSLARLGMKNCPDAESNSLSIEWWEDFLLFDRVSTPVVCCLNILRCCRILSGNLRIFSAGKHWENRFYTNTGMLFCNSVAEQCWFRHKYVRLLCPLYNTLYVLKHVYRFVRFSVFWCCRPILNLKRT